MTRLSARQHCDTKRLAAVNRALIVALALAAVGAAVYWVFFHRESGGTGAKSIPPMYTVYCSKCGEVSIPSAGILTGAYPHQGPMLKCPKCDKFTASFQKVTTAPNMAGP